jgi:hypothetical protein
LKIYKESDQDILVRIGDSDFKIKNQSVFIEKIQGLLNRFYCSLFK